jgi:NAD+ diphosphatase
MDTASFAFDHGGLDRAEAVRNQPQLLDSLWQSGRVMLLNDKGEACCRDPGEIYFSGESISLRRPEHATFLGMEGGQAYFSIAREAVTLGRATHEVNIRAAAASWGALHAAVFAQAKALHFWQAQSKFCGRCGSLMDIKTAGYNASCGACGLIMYPQTHPAVIMCVSDGERILLGRQATWPDKRWSLLAGFVEPGESPEQTVVREVFEEAGVRVDKVRYVKSQPWPMPMALMLGYDAYAPQQDITISEELQAARWFTAAELSELIQSGELELPQKISISHYMIQRWLAGSGRIS